MDTTATFGILVFGSASTDGKEELGQWFAEAAEGDPEALGHLYDRVAHELYGLALWRCGSPTLAEDAVQEVFCRLIGGAVTNPLRVRDPKAWLLASVRRATLDSLRKRSREVGLDASTLLAPEVHPETRLDALRAARAVASLPLKLREAVYLRHFSGLSFAEIGRVVKVPTFTAASRYRLGLARLRRQLEGES